MSSERMTLRLSRELASVVQSAAGESNNLSSASKALMILGAAAIGLSSGLERDIYAVLADGLSYDTETALRGLRGERLTSVRQVSDVERVVLLSDVSGDEGDPFANVGMEV